MGLLAMTFLRCRRGWTAALVLAVCVLAAGCHGAAAPAVDPTTAAPPLELTEQDIGYVRTRQLGRAIAVAGSLQARSQIEIRAKLAGELRELPFMEGMAVHAGQVVARLDSAHWRAQLAEQQALLAAAQAELDLAQATYAKQRRLVETGFLPLTATEVAQADLALKQAQQQVARSHVELAQVTLRDATSRSPIAGVVFRVHARRGEFVAANAPLLSIIDAEQLELVAAVSAIDLPAIAVGMPAQLSIAGASSQVSGTVSRISPMAEQGTRSYLLYIQVPRVAPSMAPGMFVTGELHAAARAVLVVPTDCVREINGEQHVFALLDGSARRVVVRTGERDAVTREIVIDAALAPDTPLLMNGNLALTDGQALRLPASAVSARL